LLDVEKWPETGIKFDVVTCLNLLDRCDKPLSLLRELKASLSPGGRVVVALVLPFSPYVETGELIKRNNCKMMSRIIFLISFEHLTFPGIILLTYLLTYLLHGAESFLRS
jgi:2-polyprenyl-3-methyl-5-hydroxy-6-metoxy-1,4-benzoquinol methylase